MSDPIVNPLLAKLTNRLPGETVRLPSRGQFYLNGELSEDTYNGEIVLNPMTMTDEIMMKTPDMLFQGTAIERVFQRCSPNIKKPMDLLTSDVDFILTHLRRISFGPFVEIEFTCTNTKCSGITDDGPTKQEVRVPLEHFTNNSRELDGDDINKFNITTKTDGQKVKLKPITFREFLAMQQVNTDDLNSPELLEDYILETFSAVIQSVGDLLNNDPQNRKFIKEWLHELPRSDTKRITDAVNEIQEWGPSFKYNVKCSHCGQSHEMSTELNPTAFFMLPSSPKTKSA